MTLFMRHRRALSRAPRAAERGMTLVEIMVVIVILGLIASAVGVAVTEQLDNARVDTTKNVISTIETGLKLYYTRHGRYPDTGQGLQILVTEKMLEKTPKDGWGNDFAYVNEGGKTTIVSYGADGQPGGDEKNADINSNTMRDKK